MLQMEGVGRVEGAYLDQRPDLGSWDAVFVGDAIVDHPHRLCIQSLCQLKVFRTLTHLHTSSATKACIS